MRKIEITIPIRFKNYKIFNNYFTAYDPFAYDYDYINLPLPDGNWKIYNVSFNKVTLIDYSKNI